MHIDQLIVAWAGSCRAIRCLHRRQRGLARVVFAITHAVMLLCRYNTIKMTEEMLRSQPQMGNHGVLRTRLDALYAPNAHRDTWIARKNRCECIATKRSSVQGHCDEVRNGDREWNEQNNL